MNRDQKAAVIEEVASQIKEAQAIFAVDYRGLSVKQAAELRGRLLEIDSNLRVVKNTLTERAADEVGAETLKQFLEGPTAFTFVKGDPVLAAKALAAFRKEAGDLPQFKGGLMDGKELTVADIEALSKLPSLEVMHGQLVGLVANPLSSLVRTLNALLSGIAIALGQIQEQGLVGGDAPAPEAEMPAAEADAEPATETPAEDAPEAEASAPEAVGAEDTPSAPADAPDPDAAEEIPNQPMPAPDQEQGDGDATETSNEEGDN